MEGERWQHGRIQFDARGGVPKPGRAGQQHPMCREAACINGKEFSLANVVCASSHGTWRDTLRAIRQGVNACTSVGQEIADNLVRVAATRVFSEPEQSLLELPVNSVDASLPGRASVGKFGMGFYSIVYWLVGQPARRLNVTSVYESEEGRCGYLLEVYEKDGRLMARLNVFPTSATKGTRVELLAPPGARFTAQNVQNFEKQMSRLRYLEGVSIVASDPGARRKRWNSDAPDPGPGAPAILTDVGMGGLVVEDYGTGIPVDVVLSALLTPSLSTKGVQASAAPARTSREMKTRLILPPLAAAAAGPVGSGGPGGSGGGAGGGGDIGRDFGLDVLVNEVVVYLNPTGTPLVAVLEMPPHTPVPVARDNILLGNDSSLRKVFRDQLSVLLDRATSRDVAETQPRAMLSVERALQDYQQRSRQQNVSTEVATALRETYKAQRERIVMADFIDVFHNFQPGEFVAGTAIDGMAVKARVRKLVNIGDLDNTIFQNREVIFVTGKVPPRASTGGLDGVVFVSRAFAEQYKNWSTRLGDDMTVGFSLRTHNAFNREHLEEFRTFMTRAVDLASSTYFKGETRADIAQEWTRNLPSNEPLLHTLFERLKDNHQRLFTVSCPVADKERSDFPSDIQHALASLVRCYGVYRQTVWAELVGLVVRACMDFDCKTAYGNGLSVLMLQFIQPNGRSYLARPTGLAFDVEIMRYVLNEYRPYTIGLLSDSSLGARVLDHADHQALFGHDFKEGNYNAFETCHTEVQNMHAPMQAKVNALACLRTVTGAFNNMNLTFGRADAALLIKWLKRFVGAFDHVLPTAYSHTMIATFSLHSFPEFPDVLEIKQALSVLRGLLEHAGAQHHLQIYVPAHQSRRPVFSTNQLISFVMSNEILPGQEYDTVSRSINEHTPKSNLQMVGIVVNEGNTRNFLLAVLQELVQNAVDAVRSSVDSARGAGGGVDASVARGPVVNIDLRVDNSNRLVLSVEDPVGMTHAQLLKANIPFYSGKGKSANATGEMGTGFFNVYRETDLVTIRTVPPPQHGPAVQRPEQGLLPHVVHWHSTPVREIGRVVDVQHATWTEPREEGSKGGTIISLHIPMVDFMDPEDMAAVVRATAKHTLETLDPRVVQIRLRSRVGKMQLINPTAHAQPAPESAPLANGEIEMYPTGFQRGAVCVTVTSPLTTSFLLTHGLPFLPLADFCKHLGGVSSTFMLLLGRGFVVNLPKGAYEVTQSREKLRIDPAVLFDLKLALLDMWWLAALQKWQDISELTFKAVTRTYGIRLQGLGDKGQCNQNLPFLDDWHIDAGTPDGILRSAEDDLVGRYVPFLRAKEFTSRTTHALTPSLNSWVHIIFKKLGLFKSAVTPAVVKDVVDEVLVERVPPLVASVWLGKVLVNWFLTKKFSPQQGQDQDQDQARPNIVFAHSNRGNRVWRLFDAFVRLYVKYGMAAGIQGFSVDMVKTLQVERNVNNTSSSFNTEKALLYINEATRGESGAFEALANTAAQWCSKHVNNSDLNRTALEQQMGGTFMAYMGFQCAGDGAIVVHELEHARRKSGCSTSTTKGVHDTWTGVLIPVVSRETQTLSFSDCQTRTFYAVATQQVDGIAFHVALAQAWALLS